jgi:UDP-N-acetylmuramoyl-L-alanyl-D-glutamate--2,6-diaminopimelate ligase
MKLSNLLADLKEFERYGEADPEITGIQLDSRKVHSGNLFAALPGLENHGIEFLNEAEKNGAVAVLSDRRVEAKIPLIHSDHPRLALAILSNRFYNYPSGKLKLVGITGTNGKTTVAFLVRSIFQEAGLPCGLIGTIQYSGSKFSRAATHTTPESPDLQKLLNRLVGENSKACSMEVSSQGLAQYRVAGCEFETAIFTNLTHEHLDYHKTMEDYFQSKMMLFNDETCKTRLAISNVDDSYGQRLIEIRQEKGLPTVSYGFAQGADFRMTDFTTSTRGSKMKIQFDGGECTVRTALVGQYNMYNVSAAFAAGIVNGFSERAILAGIRRVPYIPGRMEEIDFGQRFKIMIDYAHTHDALMQLLPTLRLYTIGRIIHIFGCRGAKDRSKRPKMGKVSGELADIVLLTSDNPKNEDPAKIASEVVAGLQSSGNPNYKVILDRAEAIAYAVSIARPDDTIVITGKGNETYQLIGNKKYPFNERELFLAAVQELRQ